MDIVILKEKDIKEVFKMKDAIESIKAALELYSKGEGDIPLRSNIDVPKENGQSLYMPGLVESSDALGVKIVSVYPENNKIGLDSISSLMLVQNSKTGQVSAIMDGNYLTKLRTGAISAAATDILSRKDSSILALIGSGGQAKTQLEGVLNVRDIKEVRVSARDKVKAQRFIDQMKEELGREFKFDIFLAKDADEAILDADIITTVTTAKNPVFKGELVKKGAHINGVGSYKPDMQEIPPYIVINADKIYLDTLDGVLNESGDFIIPMKEGKISKEDISGELGQVILGEISSRENEDEITFFKTVGSGIFDIITGKNIYDKALEKGIGARIKF